MLLAINKKQIFRFYGIIYHCQLKATFSGSAKALVAGCGGIGGHGGSGGGAGGYYKNSHDHGWHGYAGGVGGRVGPGGLPARAARCRG